MPNRWLKADILTSERWNAQSFVAQNVYVRLLLVADDYGNYDGRYPVLLSAIDPLRTITPEILPGIIDELCEADLVRRYVVEGKPYLHVPRFHERPRSKPKYPLPSEEIQGCTQLHAIANNCPLPTSTSTSTSTSTLGTNVPSPPDGGGGRFDLFWQAYPKKVGKQAAIRAWKKINVAPILLKAMLDKIEEQKASRQWKRDGGQYIPNPATWLNQGRWDDEVERADDPNWERTEAGILRMAGKWEVKRREGESISSLRDRVKEKMR